MDILTSINEQSPLHDVEVITKFSANKSFAYVIEKKEKK